MVANDEKELRGILIEAIKTAIDATLFILLDKLKDFIKEDLYDMGSPKQYERTMQLLNTWGVENAQRFGNKIKGEITPDYFRMKTNHSKKQHIITGEQLVTMLIQGWGDKDEWYNMPRDFWKPFENYVNKNIDKIFKQEMDKVSNGMNVNIKTTFY